MQWHVFVGRRRINVEEWLKANSIRSYGALLAWCASSNVVPPTKDEMKGQFGSKSKPKVVVIPALPVDEEDEAAVDAFVAKARQTDQKPVVLTKRAKKASKMDTESTK